jgi:hypothetical protein
MSETVIVREVGRWLDGEPLHGAIWRAGLPKTIAAS